MEGRNLRKVACLDTCGLTTLPKYCSPKVHVSLYKKLAELIETGAFAVTPEIYEELAKARFILRKSIRQNRPALTTEGDGAYYRILKAKLNEFAARIYDKNRNKNKLRNAFADLSIACLGHTMDLPVVTHEVRAGPNCKKLKLPNYFEKEEKPPFWTMNKFLEERSVTF